MSSPVFSRLNRNEVLTRAECEQVLQTLLSRNRIQGKLNDYEIEPELRCIGFLGEYFYLLLKYRVERCNDEFSKRLFVKSIPFHNADMNSFIEKSDMMKKEVKIYESLLIQLKRFSRNVWCADSYLSRNDLFVMQNVTELGYATLDGDPDFLDEALMMPLLKGLASMHACSIGYEKEHNVLIGDVLQDTLIELSVLPSVVWYTAGLRAVLAVALEHPKFQTEVMQNFIKHELPERLKAVYSMVNPSSKHRNVFCHRDVWGGNVFFHKMRPFDHGCIFVDYQLSRYSPPAVDVLLALHMNMKASVRKDCERRCIKYYYDCLAAELTDMALNPIQELSRHHFEQSIRELELFGATYNCLASTVLRLPKHYLKNLKDNHPVEFHRFTNVERTQDVKNLMRANAEFRNHMLECIETLVEVAIK